MGMFLSTAMRIPWFLSVLLLCLGLGACGALPRVIILKDPLMAEEHLQLGAAYEKALMWTLSLSEYRAALEKGADRARVEGYMGNVYFAMGAYEKAEAAYGRALKLRPKDPPILNNLASIYIVEKRKLKEAERLVRLAMENDPGRRAYYLDTLGSIYLARGEADIAFLLFREAEMLMPANVSVAGHLADNLRRAQAFMETDRDASRQRRP